MNDIHGRPLKLGDTVAYATLSYKRAHLRLGTVVPLKMDNPDAQRHAERLYIRVKGLDGFPGGIKDPKQVALVVSA